MEVIKSSGEQTSGLGSLESFASESGLDAHSPEALAAYTRRLVQHRAALAAAQQMTPEELHAMQGVAPAPEVQAVTQSEAA